MQDLTTAQRRAADRFVKANNRLKESRSQLKDARDKSLVDALDAGVFAATLGKLSGLSNARMYQLVGEVVGENNSEGNNDG